MTNLAEILVPVDLLLLLKILFQSRDQLLTELASHV